MPKTHVIWRCETQGDVVWQALKERTEGVSGLSMTDGVEGSRFEFDYDGDPDLLLTRLPFSVVNLRVIS